MIAGHLPSDTTSKYEHLTPDYLRDALRAIDMYFDALADATRGHLVIEQYPVDGQHVPLLPSASG